MFDLFIQFLILLTLTLYFLLFFRLKKFLGPKYFGLFFRLNDLILGIFKINTT